VAGWCANRPEMAAFVAIRCGGFRQTRILIANSSNFLGFFSGRQKQVASSPPPPFGTTYWKRAIFQ